MLTHGTLATVVPIALLKPFDIAREKVIAGWLRIAFFSSILLNHTVETPFEFADERMWIVWLQFLRDFGLVGFFVLAGVSLQGKLLTNDRLKLPSNLLKLTIAAAALAAFDMLYTAAKGGDPGAFRHHVYKAMYETNLWFFIAYAFAGPLLLSLDRRGIWLTASCCILFVMFPGDSRLLSPYILQTISLAFVCMAIGMSLHGRQTRPALSAAVAIAAYLTRIGLDDYGDAVYPAVDILLRIVYGTAVYLLLKSGADVLCRHVRSPGWSNYLFVPYIIQFPLVKIVTVGATVIFTASLSVNMPPIFFSFWDWLPYVLSIFFVSLAISIGVAALLRRFRIRV